ncbi:hypothetical protein [Hymenobacter profundi]|uniref:Uncharacterized protein n=1 Tax=Hymenobacter profundi TaxID=1982110 RepID=A0ABS6X3Z0_9BACT|nr:hypothetical protein [Hymenobacter profundi]MBW3130561.1 hypothetical protein [Hymenobacter profundi]
MLDFYLIHDEQSDATAADDLQHAGGIEAEEFEIAQQAGIVETTADFYSEFRWSSAQVRAKVLLLTNCPFRDSISLSHVLNQAQAAGVGLRAFGD